MSKKSKWSVDGSVLSVLMPDGGTASVGLNELFPMFHELTETQQNVVAYGVKQKLSDSCARNSDAKLNEAEAVEQMTKTWDMLLSGKFRSGTKAGAISFKVKQNAAWDNATDEEKEMLVRLGVAPAGAVAPVITSKLKKKN